MKKTVKQLTEEIEKLKKEVGSIHIEQSICYHWEQVAATLERLDRFGELIKMEITHGSEAGKRTYHLITWHATLLNEEDRNNIGGNYYSGLEKSAHRYFPIKPLNH